MIGKNHKSAVLVITDRKTRFNKFRKLNGKYAKKVTKETIIALKDLPKKSMTNFRVAFIDEPGPTSWGAARVNRVPIVSKISRSAKNKMIGFQARCDSLKFK